MVTQTAPGTAAPIQINRTRQLGLFDQNGIGFDEAFNLAVASLQQQVIGKQYRNIGVGFSGGKDSTALVTLIAYLVRTGRIQIDPRRVWILYSDTGRELPPLHDNAMSLLAQLRAEGFNTKVVRPALDKSFWVNMVGRGVPVPHQFNRWCVSHLKIDAMERVIKDMFYEASQESLEAYLRRPDVAKRFGRYTAKGREQAITRYFNRHGEKLLMLTGMRLGESQTRDNRIETICTTNGECGTGMWEPMAPQYDRLAPLVRWRLCHVYDWLSGLSADYLKEPHGYERWTKRVAKIYGDGDIRTGCMSCSVAAKDSALLRIIQVFPEYAHLAPILELRDLWNELVDRRDIRLHRTANHKSQTKDLGPYTIEGRKYIYRRIQAVQKKIYGLKGNYQIIGLSERERIFWHWQNGTFPEHWDGTEEIGSYKQLIPTGQQELFNFGE